MPLYIGDYLSNTMHLTTEQHGAYLLLLMAYWKSGAALQDDPKFLASITKMSENAWGCAQAYIKHYFDTESSPGLWVHHRVEKELAIARENHEKQVNRAKKAALARWGKDA